MEDIKTYDNVVLHIGDIVKSENSKTQEITYYLYDVIGNRTSLWVYDKKGELNINDLNNIPVGSGVALLNDEIWKWTKIGTKEEVYDGLFNK